MLLSSQRELSIGISPADFEGLPPTFQMVHLDKMLQAKGNLTLSARENIYNLLKRPMEILDYALETVKIYEPLSYDASDVWYFKATKGFCDELDPTWKLPTFNKFSSFDSIAPWRNLIKSDLHVIEVPSDHYWFFEEPGIHVVKEHLEVLLSSPSLEDDSFCL
jgi:hypothetical protein